MIVCICNNINESKVKDAVQSGSKTCCEVMKFYDCESCCGKCNKELREIVTSSCREESVLAE